MPRMPHILGLGLVAVLVAGCAASGPRTQPLRWAAVASAAGAAPQPGDTGLTLAGQPVRTVDTFTAPLTVTCDVALLEAAGPTAALVLTLVSSADEDPITVTVDWDRPPFQLKAGAVYTVQVDVYGQVRVRVNGLELDLPQPAAPASPFHLQLVGQPQGSRWQLYDLRLE